MNDEEFEAFIMWIAEECLRRYVRIGGRDLDLRQRHRLEDLLSDFFDRAESPEERRRRL